MMHVIWSVFGLELASEFTMNETFQVCHFWNHRTFPFNIATCVHSPLIGACFFLLLHFFLFLSLWTMAGIQSTGLNFPYRRPLAFASRISSKLYDQTETECIDRRKNPFVFASPLDLFRNENLSRLTKEISCFSEWNCRENAVFTWVEVVAYWKNPAREWMLSFLSMKKKRKKTFSFSSATRTNTHTHAKWNSLIRKFKKLLTFWVDAIQMLINISVWLNSAWKEPSNMIWISKWLCDSRVIHRARCQAAQSQWAAPLLNEWPIMGLFVQKFCVEMTAPFASTKSLEQQLFSQNIKSIILKWTEKEKNFKIYVNLEPNQRATPTVTVQRSIYRWIY